MKKDLFLILFGFLLSSIGYVLNKFYDNWDANKGKVYIYRRLVYLGSNDMRTSGIYTINGETFMHIHLWVEIQNMKKRPIIARDFSIYLYNKGSRVKKMKQINFEDKSTHEKKYINYYGDNGSYSFIIPSLSIKKVDLFFQLNKNDFSLEFDEIRILYYNDKNKLISSRLFIIENSWEPIQFGIDENWIEVS